jgi:type II secretory pathway pseudopilin PulG
MSSSFRSNMLDARPGAQKTSSGELFLRGASGFSLLQLMIAVSLSGVVTYWALNSYQQFRASEDALAAKISAQTQTMEFSNHIGEFLATRTMGAPLQLAGHKLSFVRRDLRKDYMIKYRIVTGCEPLPASVRGILQDSREPIRFPAAATCRVGCPEGKRPAVIIKRTTESNKELKSIRIPAVASSPRRDVLGAYFCGTEKKGELTYFVGGYYLENGKLRQTTQTRTIKTSKLDNNIEWLPSAGDGAAE